MSGRKICFFLNIFWLLLICTVLSHSIQKQMTVKVKVLEHQFFMGEKENMEACSAEILSGGVLYELREGNQWENGFRAAPVPQEFYGTEDGQILLPSNMGANWILYRTKELFPGAAAEKTSVYQGKEELYLMVSPEKAPQLLSLPGNEPYMENLQKEEMGLLPEERLYSIKELEKFSHMFILLGLLSALLVSTLLILGYNWKLAGNVRKNRRFLLVNSGILTGILLGIYKLAETIQMPSSLLPKENILDFKHYGETFGQILGVLKQLQQVGNVEVAKLLEGFQKNLQFGCLVTILGFLVCFVFFITENKMHKRY